MASFGETGSNAEILEKLGVICALHDTPQRRNSLPAADFDAIGPEAVGPAGFGEVNRGDAGSGNKQRSEGRHET